MKTNKLFKVLSLILALAMILTVAGCAGGKTESSTAEESTTTEESSTTEESTEESSEESSEWVNTTGADDTSEHYSFEIYASYDWWTVKPWGDDKTSAYWNELFNIGVTWSKPDADADAKLNLMLSSNDLPDSIVCERDDNLVKMVNLGVIVDLDDLRYEGCSYDEDILASTQEFLRIDGVQVGVPNWARKSATGGNMSWNVLNSVYEELGSPDISTLEGMHDYLVQVKESGATNASGEVVTPLITTSTTNNWYIVSAIYRSLGAPNTVASWFSQATTTDSYEFVMYDETWIEALKIANQWYREGLWTDTMVVDTSAQVIEKLSNGRAAVAYYDFSDDSTSRYNQILEDATGERYWIMGYEIDGPIYPHGDGVDYVYGEEGGTVGWNVNCITTSAENPQRIFDLYTYMLTKQGSIEMMYGPQGFLWDELDENGNPVVDMSSVSSDQQSEAGCWAWSQPAHSDNVDWTKFAVNEALPEEQQDWVVAIQANVFSVYDGEEAKDGQKFLTDENTNVTLEIDATTDLGIALTAVQEECNGKIPLITMASSDEEFESLCQSLIDFAEANMIHEIEAAYGAKRAENIEVQGYTAYQAWYDAHGIA